MILKIILEEGTKMQNFETFLKRYINYKTYLRDIKISSLLNKRCQFFIDDNNPPILVDISNSSVTSINKTIMIIDRLEFTIGTDMSIDELKADCHLLNTELANKLSSYIEYFTLNPKNADDQIVGFYIKNGNNTMFVN